MYSPGHVELQYIPSGWSPLSNREENKSFGYMYQDLSLSNCESKLFYANKHVIWL